MTLTPGLRLGPYEILHELGAGGMGEVYKARDWRLDRVVALKVLTPAIATPERLHRFEQEARAASALNHPNILTIYDVGRDGDIAWFAMEWVDGMTLRDMMKGGRLPVPRVVGIAEQIAEGLAKAHAAGIVHRDLKPENVMVSRDGFVKIVDFGIAKLADTGVAETVTRTIATGIGSVLGTVGYMSPEQASGRAVDYRSDQFSLALLIYELATGAQPFARATTAQSMAATIEAEPTPIEALNPDVAPSLSAIVQRCLAKNPLDRYDSTRDLARDLKAAAGSQAQAVRAVPGTSASRRAMIVAAIAITIAAAGGVVAWRWPRAPAARPLVAVRPFRNLSVDPAQNYFAAGVTEEIRGQLSQVSSLRLLSRNALESAGGDDPRAARALGVTQLVDGSVRVDGRRVRVTAELVDAPTQQTLWSDQYDREVADVLAVQSDVALQIARALRVRLSPGEQQRLERRPTSHPDAYALYLQSLPLPAADRARNLAAIELLRRALAIDPQFALAEARMAYRHVFMGYYDAASYIDQGMAEAREALRLDATLPAAHFVLGTGYAMKGRDADARVAFLRALELDPNNAVAMANLSVLESNFGRFAESLSWARRMFALSGHSANDFYHVGSPLVSLREDERSRRWLLEAERRAPAFSRLQGLLALLDLYGGRERDALDRISRAAAREPDNEEVKFFRADLDFLARSDDLGAALAALGPAAASNNLLVPESPRLRSAWLALRAGNTANAAMLIAEAERIARAKIDGGDNSPPLRVELAAVAALRRDSASALQWLDRVYDAGFREYGLIEHDPILATIEPASKLRAVVDRMKRDVDAQRGSAGERGLLDLDVLLAPQSAKKNSP